MSTFVFMKVDRSTLRLHDFATPRLCGITPTLRHTDFAVSRRLYGTPTLRYHADIAVMSTPNDFRTVQYSGMKLNERL